MIIISVSIAVLLTVAIGALFIKNPQEEVSFSPLEVDASIEIALDIPSPSDLSEKIAEEAARKDAEKSSNKTRVTASATTQTTTTTSSDIDIAAVEAAWAAKSEEERRVPLQCGTLLRPAQDVAAGRQDRSRMHYTGIDLWNNHCVYIWPAAARIGKI